MGGLDVTDPIPRGQFYLILLASLPYLWLVASSSRSSGAWRGS